MNEPEKTEDEERSAIGTAERNLERQVDILEVAMGTLEEKLIPIMDKGDTVSEDSTRAGCKGSSPMSESFMKYANKTEDLNGRLESILSRLEI